VKPGEAERLASPPLTGESASSLRRSRVSSITSGRSGARLAALKKEVISAKRSPKKRMRASKAPKKEVKKLFKAVAFWGLLGGVGQGRVGEWVMSPYCSLSIINMVRNCNR